MTRRSVCLRMPVSAHDGIGASDGGSIAPGRPSSYAPPAASRPHAAAVVHHGGIGTVAQRRTAGAPQCVVAAAFDHVGEALRLADLGVAATELPEPRPGMVPPSVGNGSTRRR